MLGVHWRHELETYAISKRLIVDANKINTIYLDLQPSFIRCRIVIMLRDKHFEYRKKKNITQNLEQSDAYT